MNGLNTGDHSRLNRFIDVMLMLTAGLTPVTVIYLFTHPKEGQSFVFMTLVLLISLLSGLMLLTGKRRVPGNVSFIHVLLGLGVLIVLYSVFTSKVPSYSFRHALLPLTALLFWLHLVHSMDRVRLLNNMTRILVVLAAFLSVYGIAQYYGFEFIKYSEQVQKNSVKGTIGHPNYLSSFLGPCLFLVIGYFMNSCRALHRFFCIVLVLLIISCLLLARTRAIWLGATCGFTMMFVIGLVMLALRRIGLRSWLLLQCPAVMICGYLALMVLVILPAIGNIPEIDRKFDLKERIESGVEVKSRLYYWKMAIDMGVDNPLGGLGYARFDPEFWNYTLEHQKSADGRYYRDVLPSISGSTPEHVHNEYLEIFCELGFPGLILALSIICFFIYFGIIRIFGQKSRDRSLHALCVFSGMVLILADAAFSFPWRLPASLIASCIIFAWMYEYIYPDSRPVDVRCPEKKSAG